MSLFLVPFFQIEDEKTCSYDYVEVFSGLDDYSGPLYGRYCGSTVSYYTFHARKTKVKIFDFLKKPPDIISINEALLVRFRTDGTMVFKGFSASYVSVDPFEGSEEMNSEDSEMVTPFPGYLKSIYVAKLDNDNDNDEDEDDYNEYDNYNKVKYKKEDQQQPDNKLSAEQFD